MNEATSGDIRRLERQLDQIQAGQVQISSQVGGVQTQQVELDNRLQSLQAAFHAFLDADRMAKELQLAETRIVKVRQELETTYGHYAEVRRRTTGLLQALDAGVVTHDSIQSTTEDVMLSSPRYWLAPALVALAAWIRDDRELAEQALAEAMRRDVDKTALLLALVLRRYGRSGASGRWLGQFYARQDPLALHREFVVILDAVATGAFGLEAKQVTSVNIREWLADMEAEAGFSTRQRTRWQEALVAMTPEVGDAEFPHLAAHSPSWPELRASLAAVRRHGLVLAHFDGVFSGELRIPRRLEDQIDDLLSSLVSRFDAEELPLREQEAELQSVIDTRGDLDRAGTRHQEARHAFEETIDFPGLLTNAAMHAEDAGASQGTQRLAVAMSRDWILSAHESLTAGVRAAEPDVVALRVEDWSDSIARDGDADAVAARLDKHMRARTEAMVSAVRFTGGPLWAAIGGGLTLLIGLATMSVVLIVAALAAGVYSFLGWRGLDDKRADARRRGDEARRRAGELLKAALTELVDYRESWAREDQVAEAVRDMLLAISPEQYELTRPDDVRMVI